MQTTEKVYVGISQIRGVDRGVFARVDIGKGEIVERCPIIEIPGEDSINVADSVLTNYLFYFDEGEGSFLALGYGSLYNHSNRPNVSYKIKTGERVVEFTTRKDIKKDTELTFNYKGRIVKNSGPLWFE